MNVITHGKVWPRLAILVAELVDVKELVALAALLEYRNIAGRKIQRPKGRFQLFPPHGTWYIAIV